MSEVPAISNGFTAYEAKQRAMATLESQVLPGNKTALFDALAAMGIVVIVVCFDGCGDSGQIESINGFGPGNAAVDLPTAKIGFKGVQFDGPTVICQERTAREIVETMAYDFLEQTHDGWENNDGAHGEFTFSVAERSIALDYNERFTDSTNYQHEF